MTEVREPQKNWWVTIPGILTAIAAVISAVTGLIYTLNEILDLEKKQETKRPEILIPQDNTKKEVPSPSFAQLEKKDRQAKDIDFEIRKKATIKYIARFEDTFEKFYPIDELEYLESMRPSMDNMYEISMGLRNVSIGYFTLANDIGALPQINVDNDVIAFTKETNVFLREMSHWTGVLSKAMAEIAYYGGTNYDLAHLNEMVKQTQQEFLRFFELSRPKLNKKLSEKYGVTLGRKD